MGVVPFLLSLSSRQQESDPTPEPEPTDFVFGDGYVQFTGAQLRLDGVVDGKQTSHYYFPKMLYYQGRTYFPYVSKYSEVPYSQARVLVFDDQLGFDRPRTVGAPVAVSDTHSITSIEASGDNIYITQENPHDTPLVVYKSFDNLDYTNYNTPFTIGTKVSYTHYIEQADGTFVNWARGYQVGDTGYYGIWITKSSSGFETWGSQIQITARPTGNDSFLRHYPFLPWSRVKVGNKYFTLIACRKDDGELTGSIWFYRFYVLTTEDFNIYTNLEGTYSRNVSSDGVITDALLSANFKYHEMDTDETQGYSPVVGISPTGNFYSCIKNSNGTGYSFKYYDGSWHSKAISISDLDEASITALPFYYLTCHSDNNIWMTVYLVDGGFVRPHWFKTTNQGTSWEDLGDMLPEVNDKSVRFLPPSNLTDIPLNKNFACHFSYDDPVSTGMRALVCKVAAFGVVQEIPGLTATPASSANYNSQGIFHYKAVAADITQSSNNVTSINDKFGIRNAAGTNNPVWNGTDAILVTGADSERFSLASVAGIAALSSLTIMFVAKKVVAVNSLLMTMTNTAAASQQLTFAFTGSAAQTPMLFFNFNNTRHVRGQDLVDDGNYHIATFVIRKNVIELYVDGKLQFFATDTSPTTDNLSVWQQIGKGPNEITGMNSIKIGMRDLTTDSFTSVDFKEVVGYSGTLPLEEMIAQHARLCADHGITYQNQFQVPV